MGVTLKSLEMRNRKQKKRLPQIAAFTQSNAGYGLSIAKNPQIDRLEALQQPEEPVSSLPAGRHLRLIGISPILPRHFRYSQYRFRSSRRCHNCEYEDVVEMSEHYDAVGYVVAKT